MDTIPPGPRLPLDVCAEVIQSLVPSFDALGIQMRWGILDRTSYRTLPACCLVCRDWLGCARRVLYRHVLFTHPGDVEIFLDTLRTYPFLGQLVRALSVDTGRVSSNGGYTYIPFARTDLVRKLPRLEVLTYHTSETALSRLYPSNYSFLLTQFSITTLTLCSACDTPFELCRLIWGLTNLRCLRLVDMFSALRPQTIAWNNHSFWQNMRNLQELSAKRPRCRSLKMLDLVRCENMYMLLVNFPFRAVFGDALTSVNIVADWWCVKGKLDRDQMQVDPESSQRDVLTVNVMEEETGIYNYPERTGIQNLIKYLLSLDELESLTIEVLAHPLEPQLTSGYLHGDSRGWQDSGTTSYLDACWKAMHTAISGAQLKPSARTQPFGRLRRVRVGVGHMCQAQDFSTVAFSGRSNGAYRHEDSEAEHVLVALGLLRRTGALQRTIPLLPALRELDISVDQHCMDDRTWALPAETLKRLGLPLHTVDVTVNIHCWSKKSLPFVLEANRIEHGVRDKSRGGLLLWDFKYKYKEPKRCA